MLRKTNKEECMKNVRYLLIGLAMVVAVLGAGVASASSLLGIPNLVGVIQPDVSGVPIARARVRFPSGTCDGSAFTQDLYIIIGSGFLNSLFPDDIKTRILNMKNAYSTLLSALLSGKRLEIQGLPSCVPNQFGEIFLNLPDANISVLQ
jgi:hypothetical protein